ncbi:phosphotransferase yqfL [Lactobacillus selangorensis]|uniref:Putative pyruvate, phosphate dikinase regulatory protein n=1 Tax=Lactobacillus selangorensis TaxID=81857 RepID=A0A0R2G6V2_9LACO|nr:pyruvate, water dikinase regulatory protein [Lactobacillus selangorensis]KRN29529.1 phosphotransferase yqfL [Lactobacillus selangorensis]KRN33941.1 phosphotransferase yqfL [Lactobacillus selangorensis]
MAATKISVSILSDSVGETALRLAQAALAQYPDVEPRIERFPFITKVEKIRPIVEQTKKHGGFIMHTFGTPGLADQTNQICTELGVDYFDLMTPIMNEVGHLANQKPSGEAGAIHHLNTKYFDRISAMEFAVMYDDGKDPKGFLEADIVLLGVSRTSKTPLSLFLANQNVKVANLPLVPQAHIPEEIFQIDPKKIVGLTNDPEILNNIRRERMIAYGLNPDTTYSDMDEINKELKYANDLYQKLGCMVINVANRSIEETATVILEKMGLDYYGTPKN